MQLTHIGLAFFAVALALCCPMHATASSDPSTEINKKTSSPGRFTRQESTQSLRGGVGLIHTPLASTGGPGTIRFALQSDAFRQRGVFCCNEESALTDEHQRYRSVFAIGWSPTTWLELNASIESSANRNERAQPQRQDPTNVFALGDTRWLVKLVAPPLRGPLRIAMQHEISTLSGAQRGFAARLRYFGDALFTIDFRYLDPQIPVRIASSLGYAVDHSHKLYDWTRFDDPLSREVFRFGVGVNQDRFRTRFGVDAPLRLGRHRAFGLAPMVELSWDRATAALDIFAPSTPDTSDNTSSSASGGKSSIWITSGLRSNLYDGLNVWVAYEHAVLQPSFEFGPRIPPWQVALGFGASFQLGNRSNSDSVANQTASHPRSPQIVRRSPTR